VLWNSVGFEAAARGSSWLASSEQTGFVAGQARRLFCGGYRRVGGRVREVIWLTQLRSPGMPYCWPFCGIAMGLVNEVVAEFRRHEMPQVSEREFRRK
jgi:hypothetical protein